MKRRSASLFCGVGICVIAATLSGSGFLPSSEIIVPMSLTSLSLKRSLFALSLMDLWWQRSIKAMNLRSWVCLDVLEVVAFAKHQDVICYAYYLIQAFQCRWQPHVKLFWSTGNTKWQTKPSVSPVWRMHGGYPRELLIKRDVKETFFNIH